MKKKDIVKFLTWLRNGTAFCASWFLFLVLIACRISRTEFISAHSLEKMMVLSFCGSLLFSTFFTELLIKRLQFTARLTVFVISAVICELFGFYWIGFFGGTGNALQWFTFAAIVIAMYLICIAIYQIYRKKQGELYTRALHEYQEKQGGNKDVV